MKKNNTEGFDNISSSTLFKKMSLKAFSNKMKQ